MADWFARCSDFLSRRRCCRWGMQEREALLLQSAAQPQHLHHLDLPAIQTAWTAQWARARETHTRFLRARDLATSQQNGEINISDKHFHDLRCGHWLIDLSQHFNTLSARMLDGTDAPLNPKRHLRTVDFMLRGDAVLKVVDEDVDISRFFADGGGVPRRLARVLVTVPPASFPPFGSSRFLATHGDSATHGDGHRLTPTLPIDATTYWTKKTIGYQKYGPTFVQFLDSFAMSENSADRIRVDLDTNTFVVTHLSDKTRPICGGEKVVVRGRLHLENIQRQKLIFPVQTEGKSMLFESVDGYLEGIDFSAGQLQLSMLVPHNDDVTTHSFPFGPAHPAPNEVYHHHNSYSRMFHVHPLTGAELIRLAGASGNIALPAGTILEHTLFGALELGGLAALIGGGAAE